MKLSKNKIIYIMGIIQDLRGRWSKISCLSVPHDLQSNR